MRNAAGKRYAESQVRVNAKEQENLRPAIVQMEDGRWSVSLDRIGEGVVVDERLGRIIYRALHAQRVIDGHHLSGTKLSDNDRKALAMVTDDSCYTTLLYALGVHEMEWGSRADGQVLPLISNIMSGAPVLAFGDLETHLQKGGEFPYAVTIFSPDGEPEHSFTVLGFDSSQRLVCFDRAGKGNYTSSRGGFTVRTLQGVRAGYDPKKHEKTTFRALPFSAIRARLNFSGPDS